MKKNPQSAKNSVIVIRVSEEEKTALKEKAAQSGVPLTTFLLNSANKSIIFSPLAGREAVRLLHSLHLQLDELHQQGADSQSLKDSLSEIARRATLPP